MFGLELHNSTTQRAGAVAARHPLDRRRRHCIYLAAPLPAYDLPAYGDALSYLRSIYPEPRHRVLSSRDLFTSTQDWRDGYRRVLETVTGFYLLLYRGSAGRGCRAEWQELAARGVPAFCFSSARAIVVIGSFVPSGEANPSLAWHVLDPMGRRILPYRFTDADLDRTLTRFGQQQRRRDWWLRRGAPMRRMRGGR